MRLKHTFRKQHSQTPSAPVTISHLQKIQTIYTHKPYQVEKLSKTMEYIKITTYFSFFTHKPREKNSFLQRIIIFYLL